ncbi:E3 SUMO-protein ligase KIAA1586-like, partial [Aphis craccivora]
FKFETARLIVSFQTKKSNSDVDIAVAGPYNEENNDIEDNDDRVIGCDPNITEVHTIWPCYRLMNNTCTQVKNSVQLQKSITDGKLRMSREWMDFEILAAGSNRTNQLSSLRIKIKQHSESKSHIFAENVLKKGSEQVLDRMFEYMSETVINSSMRISNCILLSEASSSLFTKINGLDMGSFLHMIPIVVFFDLIELDRQDAVNIEKALWLSLEKIGILKSFALKNWIAFASDGASAMTGTKSGVAAKLCEKIPRLFTWHCLCHRLELSVHDVIKDVQGVSRFQSLMDRLYSYYHQSPKNSRALDEACLEIGIEMKKIGRILNVRWSARIHKHVSQTLEIGLKKKLESSSFLEELGLFYDVLFELGMLSCILQKRKTT